ncbi:hypothetical protein [Burkholderia sp. 8Y]|uniref:hypothetical protein n=1 Tax=Burkholderia sp. 8Y TaxID=2653133 RepID=UPI0013594EE4|nr:hypothetical protein [Burkholderia sp. 8Y]
MLAHPMLISTLPRSRFWQEKQRGGPRQRPLHRKNARDVLTMRAQARRDVLVSQREARRRCTDGNIRRASFD